ncbi:hypothetical protein C8J57DRAFT_1604315 [Mycena rebaudengoi]|nr:hypothetical protein C8J57DRAFT_1604315 [Mycena rebaudengoi]
MEAGLQTLHMRERLLAPRYRKQLTTGKTENQSAGRLLMCGTVQTEVALTSSKQKSELLDCLALVIMWNSMRGKFDRTPDKTFWGPDLKSGSGFGKITGPSRTSATLSVRLLKIYQHREGNVRGTEYKVEAEKMTVMLGSAHEAPWPAVTLNANSPAPIMNRRRTRPTNVFSPRNSCRAIWVILPHRTMYPEIDPHTDKLVSKVYPVMGRVGVVLVVLERSDHRTGVCCCVSPDQFKLSRVRAQRVIDVDVKVADEDDDRVAVAHVRHLILPFTQPAKHARFRGTGLETALQLGRQW